MESQQIRPRFLNFHFPNWEISPSFCFGQDPKQSPTSQIIAFRACPIPLKQPQSCSDSRFHWDLLLPNCPKPRLGSSFWNKNQRFTRWWMCLLKESQERHQREAQRNIEVQGIAWKGQRSQRQRQQGRSYQILHSSHGSCLQRRTRIGPKGN